MMIDIVSFPKYVTGLEFEHSPFLLVYNLLFVIYNVTLIQCRFHCDCYNGHKNLILTVKCNLKDLDLSLFIFMNLHELPSSCVYIFYLFCILFER